MKKLKYILLMAISLVFAGCQHDTDVFEGPALNDLYGEYGVVTTLNSSDNSVDFAGGEQVYFTAEFTKNVDWQLEITGLASGAKKIITGKSNTLNAANATWNGSTTIFPMFLAELCEVMLTIPAEMDTLLDSVSINSVKVDEGFLLADFENGMNPDWDLFEQSGANMSFDISNQGDKAQGNFFYDMGGEVNWDWLIGMLEFPADAYGTVQFPLSDNPNEVYLNLLLYKPTGVDNGIVLIQLREDENADGTINDANEDMYSVELKLQDEGWQLVSLKYSDLQALNNGQPVDANGNGVMEPHKLGRVSVLFLANPSSGYSQTYMDYVIFTQGAPLTP